MSTPDVVPVALQLFIATAEPALPLFEAMGFGPMPAFPSIRGAP